MDFIDKKRNKLFNDIVEYSKENKLEILELNEVHSNKYKISNIANRLNPIVDNVDVIIPAGAFFGDEAKGKTSDAIARHPEVAIVARVNSGENAGHTVYHNGIKFVFNLTPSAVFTKADNLIGANCVMDPISFMEKEVSQLVNNNVDYKRKLFVGNVSIVTPYHKIMDALGRANSSTLKGMSSVHASKSRKKDIRIDDLYASKEHQERMFKSDMLVYEALLQKLGEDKAGLIKKLEAKNSDGNIRIPKHVLDFLRAENPIEYLYNLYQDNVVNNENFPKIIDTQKLMHDTLKKGKKIILEGPQSYFLSNMVETHHRSSTSADTSGIGIAAASGINLAKYKLAVINVHKAPASSRVGLGSNPAAYVSQTFFSDRNIETLSAMEGRCEDFNGIQKAFFESIDKNGLISPVIYLDKDEEVDITAAMAISSSREYGERGATTLKPRITGMFDCVAHFNLNEAQGPYLTISALDRGDVCDKIGIVIAYIVSNKGGNELVSKGIKYNHGDIIKAGDSLPNENVLEKCVPVVKVLDAWKDTPIAATKGAIKYAEYLPKNVARFISEIEYYTGAEVISIGNGPETENLIYIKREK